MLRMTPRKRRPKEVDWDDIQAELNRGDVFMVAGLYDPEKRKREKET